MVAQVFVYRQVDREVFSVGGGGGLVPSILLTVFNFLYFYCTTFFNWICVHFF